MLELAMRERVGGRVEGYRRRRFERLVAQALDGLPPHVLAMLDNVEIVVEDEPTPAQRRVHAEAGDGATPRDDAADGADPDDAETLFGLYEGIPRAERGGAYSLVVPDKITIFRGPLERAFRSPAAIAREVRVTVLHELGHHLGLDEERLEALGLG